MIELPLSNFSGGEVAPEVQGRLDAELFKNSLKRCENFISMTQGALAYRGGSTYDHPTRQLKAARLEKFVYSDDQVYTLEFTDYKLRLYLDDALVLNTGTVAITGATKADPCVISATSHGFVTGDEIYITGVVGMTELNGRFFRVVYIGANSFSIVDLFGNAVDSTAFTTWSSGGTISSVYELATPWPEADVDEVQFDQTGNDVTFTHNDYAPARLTRNSATSWTLATTFSRTADPFVSAAKNITGITQANPGVITSAGHGYVSGHRIKIAGIVGMTELNGASYIVVRINDNTFSLTTLAGVAVNTTAYTAWSSGGTCERENYPATCCYFQGCLYYGGLKDNPDRWCKSRGPDATGVSRYDDFTTGSDDDHAIISNLASIKKQSAFIHWMTALNSFIAIGTEPGVVGLDGGGDGNAITPTSYRTNPVDTTGVNKVVPVSTGDVAYFVQKGGRVLRSFEYDLYADKYRAYDRSFVAPHLSISGFKKLVFQYWKLGLVWAVCNDGRLVCLTAKAKEDVTGWHRHTIGGNGVSILDAVVEPQEDGYDILKLVVERTINDVTVRYIERIRDPWEGLDFKDYFTGDEEADRTAFLDELYESLRNDCNYLDSNIRWDGSARGTITMTPGATTGEGITFTASAPLFAATDVGKLISKRYRDRIGGGQAKIKTFVSSTEVTCDVQIDFDNDDVIPAGDWFLSAKIITGLWHLEGETISVVADGYIHKDVTVTNGTITLSRQAFVVLLGYRYRGVAIPMNLTVMGQTDNSMPLSKNICELSLMVANTIGVQYGTNIYDLQEIFASEEGQLTNRPPVPLSGTYRLSVDDFWSTDKEIIYVQSDPYPCMLQAMNVSWEAGEK
jgi:hypothetical protein